MANYNTLKTSIEAVIKQNGNNEITGPILQQTLLAMVNSLGANYQYAGIATPATNPGTPDQNVFYLASTAGTYTNFGGLVLDDGEIAILKYNGAWSKDSTGAASLEKVNQLGQETTGVIQTELIQKGISSGQYEDSTTRVCNSSAINTGNDIKVTCKDSVILYYVYKYKSSKSPIEGGIVNVDYIQEAVSAPERINKTIPFDPSFPNLYLLFANTSTSSDITPQDVSSNSKIIDLGGTSAEVDSIDERLNEDEQYVGLKALSYGLINYSRLYSDGTIGGGFADGNYVSTFIPVVSGGKYRYKGYKTSSSYRSIAGYSSAEQGSYVGTFADPRTGGDNSMIEVTIPSGVNFVRIAYIAGSSEIGIFKITTDGLIDSIEKALHKLDNLDKLAKELNIEYIPFTFVKNHRINTSGQDNSGYDDNSYVSDFIPVTPGSKYYYGGSKTSNSYLTLAGYASKDVTTFVDSFADPKTPGDGSIVEITIPNGVNFVKIAYYTTYITIPGIWIVPSDIFKYIITQQVGGYSIWVGTQTQYDSITTKDAKTLYFIEE